MNNLLWAFCRRHVIFARAGVCLINGRVLAMGLSQLAPARIDEYVVVK